MDDYTLLHGDCLAEMAAMDAGSVDAVVCDPPYGLEFMGAKWDRLQGNFKASNGSGEWAAAHGAARKGFDGYSPMPSYDQSANVKCPDCDHWLTGRDPAKPDKRAGYRCTCGGASREKARQSKGAMQTWHTAWATEALRVLKPSHYLLAFGGTRTWHRLACAIEDAGFEIRDTLMWLYGSGFPKGKSCLKPAWEPIILARKPGPMRELGIEECRVGWTDGPPAIGTPAWGGPRKKLTGAPGQDGDTVERTPPSPSGRWPANLVLECTCDETREGTAHSSVGAVKRKPGQDGAAYGGDQRPEGTQMVGYGKEPVRIHTDPNCPCAMLDGQTGTLTSGALDGSHITAPNKTYGARPQTLSGKYAPDSGGASRFFFRADYDEGDVTVDTDYHRQINQRSTQ